MQMKHGWVSALVLVALPLLLGNKGCETDAHELDAESEREQAGPDSSVAEGDDATLPGEPSVKFDGGTTPQLPIPVRDASVTSKDAGGATPGRCGTRGGVTCAANEFCNYSTASMCGALDQGGVCVVKPEICTLIYAPVCGCDGKTYGSECNANSKGMSVASKGECGGGSTTDAGIANPGGKMCGGFAGLACEKGQFCNYEIEAGGQGCDGIADGAGVCQTTPGACTLEYNPVCGCDRRTYGTACAAHSQGQSVLHKGACTEIDCKAIGGHPVDGIGPAPKCPSGETDHGSIVYSNGQIAIEGTICCVK